MTGLADFLSARITEDEAVARLAAGDGGWSGERHPFEPHWTADDHQPYDDGKYWPTVVRNGQFVIAGGRGGEDDGVSAHQAQHIARHDPARVLAECEAKRRIVEEHETIAAAYPGCTIETDPCCAICSAGGEYPGGPFPCPTVRFLARPYADHPDYDRSWRP